MGATEGICQLPKERVESLQGWEMLAPMPGLRLLSPGLEHLLPCCSMSENMGL